MVGIMVGSKSKARDRYRHDTIPRDGCPTLGNVLCPSIDLGEGACEWALARG